MSRPAFSGIKVTNFSLGPRSRKNSNSDRAGLGERVFRGHDPR